MVQGWREIGDPFCAFCGSAADDDDVCLDEGKNAAASRTVMYLSHANTGRQALLAILRNKVSLRLESHPDNFQSSLDGETSSG